MKNDRIAKGFNRLAPVYTNLSRIAFGKSLALAQHHFLDTLKAGDRILILGGGTGDFLKTLLRTHALVTVDYIDISKEMIRLARANTQNPSRVNFITGTEQDIPDRTYTVVITNFYLDLFSNDTLPDVVKKIKAHLHADAHWLVTDFVSEKSWHKIMLWIMYQFFKVTTGIEASRLPDWSSALKKAGAKEISSKKFYRGFIKSSLYKFVIL